MKIILCDSKPELVEAWNTHFDKHDDVEVKCGDILNEKSEAIVSPANSFGFMDGGFDYVLSEFFGWSIGKKVRSVINEQYRGELLVGQSLSVETNHQRFPYLIVAPTMRTPYNVNNSINAYLAMRAILLEAVEKQYESVAIVGLCTNIGKMTCLKSAYQMYRAYEEVMLKDCAFVYSLKQAYDDTLSMLFQGEEV